MMCGRLIRGIVNRNGNYAKLRACRRHPMYVVFFVVVVVCGSRLVLVLLLCASGPPPPPTHLFSDDVWGFVGL